MGLRCRPHETGREALRSEQAGSDNKMLKRAFDAYPLAAFYVLAVLIATGVVVCGFVMILVDPGTAAWPMELWAFIESRGSYMNLVGIAAFALDGHVAGLLILIFAAAPTLAAVAAVLIRSGADGLRSLLQRLKPWCGDVTWQRGLTVWAGVIGAYLAISLLYLWLTDRLAGPYAFDIPYSVLGGAVVPAVGVLLLGLLIDEGGTLEELGWRGYALPLLLDRSGSPLRATALLGVLWWAWHLPREITPLLGGIDLMAFFGMQLLFLLLCVALSIIITWVFFLTGGSAWAGIIVHGGTNVWSKALQGPLQGATGLDVRTWLVIIIALAILIATRGRLGARPAADSYGSS